MTTLTLRLFFSLVLAVMLAVTLWAGSQVPLWAVPRTVGLHPWFLATLADAYCGFLTFWLWILYREPSWPSRLLWLAAVLLLGNIAMAAYGLATFWRLPADARPSDLLLRGRPVSPLVPAGLLTGLAAVTLAGALHGAFPR